MKRTFADAILFFLAMNFLGVVAAIGIMVGLGKLNAEKMQEIRALAFDEVVAMKPETIRDFKDTEEKYKALKTREEVRSKQEGLSESFTYDHQIAILKKREEDIKNYENQIKTESEISLKRWQEISEMLNEIKKRQTSYDKQKQEDAEKTKSDQFKTLLKRYDSMEAENVARALLGINNDPKTIKPIIDGKEADPRVKEAALYLKEMKPARSAEIMEIMGPLWTNALQKYMGTEPVQDNKQSKGD